MDDKRIRLKEETRNMLKKHKLFAKESYDEVINRKFKEDSR